MVESNFQFQHTQKSMKPSLQRLNSIDCVRGLVILLMALDHTRDYFSGAQFSPLDLEHTNATYFLTRWITHICAPTFVFLAGASAYLSTARQTLSKLEVSAYLAKRGLWLIILELTVVRFGWTFNLDFHYAIIQVIWALGWSMLVLSVLVFLSRWAIALFAVLNIFGHNVLDAVQPSAFGSWAWIWTVLHVPGNVEYWSGYAFSVLYPLIPWLGVMAAGYYFGPLFLESPKFRLSVVLGLVGAMLVLFLVLRLFNLYGDSSLWTTQKDSLTTFLSFINVSKYPPSLLYLLVTLSVMFLLLLLFEWTKVSWFNKPLLIFGKTPLFFYVLHIPLIHGAMALILQIRGLPNDWLFKGSLTKPFPEVPVPEYGYDLGTVYFFWMLVVCLLFPLCNVFSSYKQNHPEKWWLSYL